MLPQEFAGPKDRDPGSWVVVWRRTVLFYNLSQQHSRETDQVYALSSEGAYRRARSSRA